MKRYDNILKKKDKDTKKIVYNTHMYPEIPLENSDIYIWTKQGDRLDSLAFRYYKNPKLWWIIAQANNLGEGGFALTPAIRIRIPQNVSKIINKLNRFNNER